ncbi:3437_t:CDS:2 [Dentiscutata heterogama]|uniref:3437_t:CDS:1 n=1 Tax=Dentiscutata heterogama TaxID=1316150 RepID=A0ACA9K7D6_9GLOM|nr:3437_t:CDS:2 [Dentiscutata heterogama]
MRKIIFTTPLTPETFCYESKVKRRKTIKNSQVLHHKVQQKSQLTVNANPIETLSKMVEQSMNIERQGILSQELLTYENRCIFYNNFSYIRAMRRMGNKDYWSTYKVNKLGHYPPISKFTRKHNGIAYQIPDKYEIETSLAGLSIRCKTQYQQAGNINYTISWIDSCSNTLSSSSTTSASNVGANIVNLELVKLKIADQDITLNYQHKNKDKQYYNSLVWICDKTSISHNRYRKLVTVDTNMVQEYLVEQQREDINSKMKQHLPIALFNINQVLELEKDIVEI